MIRSTTRFFLLALLATSCSKTAPKNNYLVGNVFGTTFHIRYADVSSRNFEKPIDSLFQLVNQSLSTYSKGSLVSQINAGATSLELDSFFSEVFYSARRIYKETEGAFDPTIGVLVNAWGFGPEKALKKLDSSAVRALLPLVGFDKVSIFQGRLQKTDPRIYLDFNAIAKGFGVDVIGAYLESQNIENYLVEIGGELRARGTNFEGRPWSVGIEKPHFDATRSLQKIVFLKNASMATSGNYRKYKTDSLTGEKYAHTLDAKTGRPTKGNLLSATVIAPIDCAEVDAYATALMAMGFEKSKAFLKTHPKLEAFLIYVDAAGGLREHATPGLKTP